MEAWSYFWTILGKLSAGGRSLAAINRHQEKTISIGFSGPAGCENLKRYLYDFGAVAVTIRDRPLHRCIEERASSERDTSSSTEPLQTQAVFQIKAGRGRLFQHISQSITSIGQLHKTLKTTTSLLESHDLTMIVRKFTRRQAGSHRHKGFGVQALDLPNSDYERFWIL